MTKPLRILVVEDEMTIALLIEDMLTEMGHEVVALAMRLQPALVHAQTADIDFAILDINLDGKQSFPVADILTSRGVPFTFASGYGSTGLEIKFAQAPTLAKPYQPDDLQALLVSAMINPERRAHA